jgi:uncharacterized SAM-binding protein YcdF (DUF218 family)
MFAICFDLVGCCRLVRSLGNSGFDSHVCKMNFSKLKIVIFVLGSVIVMYFSSLVWLATQMGDNARVSDAVVVLGARVNYSGRWNPCLLARVEHGAKLVKAGQAKYLIVSGGTDLEDGTNEARAMRDMAIQFGISSQQIILEPKATSTFENLKYAKLILEQRKLRSLIVVTEKFHAPRAKLIASKLGLNFSSSPTPESACWSGRKYFSRYFLREPFAVFENWLKGNV